MLWVTDSLVEAAMVAEYEGLRYVWRRRVVDRFNGGVVLWRLGFG